NAKKLPHPDTRKGFAGFFLLSQKIIFFAYFRINTQHLRKYARILRRGFYFAETPDGVVLE
ncbi:MAG: hypothetical protein LBJ25_07380, partial [Candidatus Margulisbacteria bacterium]|nr:hypothetical protein [Candidatus Margulisiibacteriota bacterium]